MARPHPGDSACPGEGDLCRVDADAAARPVAGGPVPAGRRAGPCRPVPTGAGRGDAILVPPARHLTLRREPVVPRPWPSRRPARPARTGPVVNPASPSRGLRLITAS